MIIDQILAPEARFTSTTADLHHWKGIFPHLETVSGERVTAAAAMGVSAFFACLRNISEDMAKLPLHVFMRDGRNRTPVPEHPVDYLLSTAPNPEMTAMAFREMLTAHAVGWGNGYAEIQVDGAGRPTALWPMDPTTIHLERRDGQLTYVQWTGTEKRPLKASRVFHLHGLAYDGISGYSIITLAREALGAAIAAQKFGGAFFGNGTWIGGVLQHPDHLGDKAQENLRNWIEDRHRTAAKAWGLLIAEEGMTYEQLGTDPEKAQLIEAQQYYVENVARFFRMPLHKIGHLLRATFSNIEHQGLEYVSDTMLPWLARWEQEAKLKLFAEAERPLFMKHNVTALLRADAAARANYYSTMLQNGVFSVNEVRALEDTNSIPEGDDHYHQLNMIKLGEEPPEPKLVKALPQGAGEEEEEGEGSRALTVAKAHTGALADAYGRILRPEADKVTRARKRGDLDEWIDGFYERHAEHVRAALLPAVRTAIATGRLMGCMEPVPELLMAHVEGMVSRHIEESRADMGPGAVEDWLKGRAERQAEAEARRLVGIIAELPRED